jgi:signal transduction histidine kinase
MTGVTPQDRFLNRLWQTLGSVSVRVKVLGIVLGMVTLLGFFVTIQMRQLWSRTLREALVQQGSALTERVGELSAPYLTQQNYHGLSLLLKQEEIHYSTNAHNTEVAYLLVLDLAGNVLADTYAGDVPGWLASQLGPVTVSTHTHSVTRLAAGPDSVLNIASIEPEQGIAVHLGLSERILQATVNTVTWQLVLTTLVMVVVGFGAAFFLASILTHPIRELVEATEMVEHGDFSRRVKRWANDEIGELADAFNSMTAALALADHERAERERLRARYISGVIMAQEDERKRIARELHDSTSQSLTSVLIGLRNLEGTPDPALLSDRLSELRQIVDGTLDEVRAMAWQLRPAILDDHGLLAALERLTEDYRRRYVLPVDFVAKGLDPRLPVEVETTTYRIVQEGLTNVVRHAAAGVASVLIDRQPHRLQIIIEDNGCGFDPGLVRAEHGESLGLQGIWERARLLGGDLTIESQPGQGTSLYIKIPLDASGRSNEGLDVGGEKD